MTGNPWRWFFALVWLVNGIGAKLLGLVPHHREIVARILGEDHAALLTRAIGAAEVVMALWILSGWRPGWAAAAQIVAVAAMNVLEFLLAPDLLLFGRWNAAIALAYIALVAREASRHAWRRDR